MIETRYKILTGNQTSPYRGQKYRRRKWYHEPHIGKAGKNGCVRGLYAVPVEGLLYRGLWRDDEHAYECRVRGQQAGESPLKECWEHLQVIRRLDEHEVRSLARAEHDRLWYLLEDALYPLHPLRIERGPVTSGEIESLWQWASVRDSVGDSVRDSVWDSVRASAGAYTGSFFDLPKWVYVKHDRNHYPFQSAVDLWERGIVPSFDGKIWRLHAADGIIWEGTISSGKAIRNI